MKCVDELHHLGNRRIELQLFDIFCRRIDKPMGQFQGSSVVFIDDFFRIDHVVKAV